ncbi:MAG: amino acid adenylation domain-containing protein, partial [Acidobacteriota bacterium]
MSDLSRRIAGLSAKKQRLLEQLLRQRRGLQEAPLPDAPIRQRKPGQNRFPLSFAQQRLWFLDRLEPGSAAYNIPLALHFSGPLCRRSLARSLAGAVQRHEALRTRFEELDGRPLQVVESGFRLDLPLVDLSGLGKRQGEREAERLARLQGSLGFDLSRAPLLRALLLRLSAQEHQAVLTLHHIIADGWSMGLLAREVGQLYAGLQQGRPAPLAPLALQYGDYALQQARHDPGRAFRHQMQFWKGRLEGLAPLMELPLDHPRPAQPSQRGRRLHFSLPARLAARISRLARDEGTTPFTLLLASFQVLLARWSGSADLAVGTPVAGRSRVELEELIGLFVNTLVMRAQLPPGLSFRRHLRQSHQAVLQAQQHQELPFEWLVAEVAPQRSLNHAPLFQVLLSFQSLPEEGLQLPGLDLSPVPIETGKSRFDLSLELTEKGGQIKAALEYALELFDPSTMQRLAGHWRRLLEEAVDCPQQDVWRLGLLSGAERHQLLRECNDTACRFGGGGLLPQRLSAKWKSDRDATALVFEEASLSYGELGRRAARVAGLLQERGAGCGSLVGVFAERSLEMVTALLGILHSGAAYLPLDPEYPPQRLSAMLRDAQAALLLAQQSLLDGCPPTGAEVVGLEEAVRRPAPADLVCAPLQPEHPAYAIFTSGSTGRPKGPLVPHEGILNRLLWMQRQYALSPGDRVLQKTPFSFDVSVWEIFWPLMEGACLVVARPGGHRDPFYLARLIRRQRIGTLHFVPSMLQAFLSAPQASACGTLRRVICSGEALTAELQQRFFECLPEAELHNLYGPTEASVDVTCWRCSPSPAARSVPIGRPVANTQIQVLDRNLQPLALGAWGELLIGGGQLARCYLSQPAQTAERFIPDPIGDSPGQRLYRTGDLVRRLWDGALDFLGRIDFQVKIRGMRIELGEIEAALLGHPEVAEAVAAVRGGQLIAYIIEVDNRRERRGRAQRGAEKSSPRTLRLLSATSAVQSPDLRHYLRDRLPEFMVPSAFVTLESMPLTPSGKVDRRALPLPEADQTGTEYAPPATPSEELLAEIWADVLDLPQAGAQDHFFERGGHSLLATLVISRIREVWGVELPLRAMFEAPTLSALAGRIDEARGASGQEKALPPLVAVPRREDAPLSFAQQRLWILDQLEPGTALYNIPAALRLKGPLELAAVQAALDGVVSRHETLRTTFHRAGREPLQRIHPPRQAALSLIDLSGCPAALRERELQRLVRLEARCPFDLQRGPLLRVRLVRLAPADHAMLATMHHIVSDAWSMGILIREAMLCYQAYLEGSTAPLSELGIQYADFALWQRSWLKGEALQEQLRYWKEQLGGVQPLDLPLDRPRPEAMTRRGSSLEFRLSPQLARSLRQTGRRLGATLYMTLLAAFQALLRRYTGQQDVSLGSPIANRTRPETEGLIGFFINILVMRTDLSGDPTFGDLLGRVRETALNAYSHQDLPFEQLVEALQPQRTLNRTPLFQVMFSWLNAPVTALQLGGIELQPMQSLTGTAKYDLTLLINEESKGLSGILEYSQELFDASTVLRLRQHYRILLEQLASDPRRRLSDLPLMSEAEAQQLLREWNDTRTRYPAAASIPQLFEEQAAQSPDRVAAAMGEQQLSYAELKRRAGQLAHYLRQLGAGPEMLIGLCLERSLEVPQALLGILDAGCG